jgi:putative PIN family toxin of toxin-antitoxin system
VFVLLDSNVWLAALARDGVCRRMLESSAAFCTPVVTPFLCAEVREKLVTRFDRTEEQADELVSKLISVSLLRDDVAEISSTLRDPDDNPILGAAVAYHCEFLVTGDDHLLELKSFSGVEIVSVRAFAERLELKID